MFPESSPETSLCPPSFLTTAMRGASPVSLLGNWNEVYDLSLLSASGVPWNVSMLTSAMETVAQVTSLSEHGESSPPCKPVKTALRIILPQILKHGTFNPFLFLFRYRAGCSCSSKISLKSMGVGGGIQHFCLLVSFTVVHPQP